jgi:hypothetical protein
VSVIDRAGKRLKIPVWMLLFHPGSIPACGISPHSIRRPPLLSSKKAACEWKWTQ